MNSESDTPSIGTATVGQMIGRGSAVALLVALVVFTASAVCLRDVTIDDVGISYRYARHLAEGKGLTWNVDAPPVEGYSNFLWVLILAAARYAGLDVDLTARILGALCGAATLIVLSYLQRRITSRESSGYAWVTPILVALHPTWTMWLLSGLEIGLFSLALVTSIYSLTGTAGLKRGLLAVSLVVLTLTRPEGAALSAVLLLTAWLSEAGLSPAKRPASYGLPAACVLVVSVGMLIFRLVYYGYPLPNTVYAKFSTHFPSAAQVGDWLVFGIPLWLAWIVAARRWLDSAHRTAYSAALALVIAQTLFVLPVNPVMNFLHRYMIAFLPLAVLPIPLVLRALGSKNRVSAAAAIVVLALWACWSWPDVLHNYAAQQFARRRQECVAGTLRSLPDTPRLALIDAGRIPYWTDLPAIDVWGLCERRIAHEGFSPEAVLAGAGGAPAIYVMSLDMRGEHPTAPFGADILVAQQPFFQQAYRLWALCGVPPSDRPRSDNPYWFLDYGIFMNIDWAAQHGIVLPATP